METTTQNNKKEIIQLLLADMRSRKLLLGLERAGLTSEDFYTGLCYVIIAKIGFDKKKSTDIYIWYETIMQSILDQELPYFKEKQRYLAGRVYQMLLEKKYELSPSQTNPRKMAAQRLLDWFMK